MKESGLDNNLLSKDRVIREIRTFSRYIDANLVIYALNVSLADSYVLGTFQEAISCPNSSKWKLAMKDEIDSYILVTKPGFYYQA